MVRELSAGNVKECLHHGIGRVRLQTIADSNATPAAAAHLSSERSSALPSDLPSAVLPLVGCALIRIVLEPRSSIGFHRHFNEVEYYYVVKGRGAFVEGDGTRTPITARQTGVIDADGGHGIENTEASELEVIALLISYDVR